jgi:hypothetical protein
MNSLRYNAMQHMKVNWHFVGTHNLQFKVKDERGMFLWNLGWLSADYMVSYPGR